MLIRFEIQMNDNGRVSGVQAQPNANPNGAAQNQTLGPAFVTPTPAAQNGGDAPLSGIGTGLPTTAAVPSGAGPVFVIGPIVVFGSSPGAAPGLGGDAPHSGIGTGSPAVNGENNKQDEKATAEKAAVNAAARRPTGKR